jgi:hypothetical protein
VVRAFGVDPKEQRTAMSEEELLDLVAGHAALTDEERAMADSAKSIDEKFSRPTEADVKALLDKLTTQQDEDGEAPSSEQEAVKELG